jgi:hypothetical protein
MTRTRRLAAILAADVAEYSGLIGAGEGGTLGSVRCRPAMDERTHFAEITLSQANVARGGSLCYSLLGKFVRKQ